jgi:PPK2 family polyphosphate:nucleotide phosphotransferase
MAVDAQLLAELAVPPGGPAGLDARSTSWRRKLFGDVEPAEAKKQCKRILAEYTRELAEAQELLWASDTYSLLIVLQALDAAGKDGTIKHVMSGVNPQGCHVRSFKQPSAEELDHDFLWRAAKALPERGQIGIFNRSYYEEVLVVRVHPEFLDAQRLPPGPIDQRFWQQRYDSINDFERHLDRSGTKLVKLFLHVSKEEQRERLLARLAEPEKEWKFSAGDVAERAHWDEYMQAFEDALTATSTEWAPWYVVPADQKYISRTLVAGIIAHTIRALDLEYPTVSPEDRAANQAALAQLQAEGS